MAQNKKLIPNIDFYINADGSMVFTEKYLLGQGQCCQSGCLHCPYGYKDKVDPNVPAEFRDAWEEEIFKEEENEKEEDEA